MDTLKPLLLVASISISYLYVESLDCQNGTRKVLLGRDAELENTLELIACPTNMPQSCVRFEIKSEHPHGQTNLEVTTTEVSCLPSSNCSTLSCDKHEQGFANDENANLVSCAFGCCDGNNCNNALVSTFSPTPMMTSPMNTLPRPSPSIIPSPPTPTRMPETLLQTTTDGGDDGVTTTSGSPRVLASSLWLLFTTLSVTVSSSTLSLM